MQNFTKEHHIRLKKGKNIHILWVLLINYLLKCCLCIYKWVKGIHSPIIHYYAVCWNEEKMLPFMFDYYERFVDKFTIYDNYSDDKSEIIINSHANSCMVKFQTGGFDDSIHNDIKNNCWKHSRGKADYVVVCDMDEFIYHRDIHKFLLMLKDNKFTIVKPFGYNMYSTDYPVYSNGELITQQVRRGVRVPMFDKCILFDPHAIVEINYKPGAHECHPWGRVKAYRSDEIKLLHYKNIGLEQLLDRNRLYVARLSKENIENNYGAEYLKREQLIIQEFNENEQKATEII